MSQSTRGWTLNDWQQAYRNQHLQPAVLAELLAELSDSDPAWISLASAQPGRRRTGPSAG